MASPLHIGILLHIYSRVEPYGPSDQSYGSPAYHLFMAEFLREGMIVRRPRDEFGKEYELTEKGQDYVKRLRETPF